MPERAVSLEIIGVSGLPEIEAGADLGALIADATALRDGDCVVVTQKIVSKAEGRLVALDGEPEAARRQIIEGEARRVLRRRGDLVITETHHGLVCANSGVDQSNVPEGFVALLPVDPDRSAANVRRALEQRTGAGVAVVISDTFGRPWRMGLVDVAIGSAGLRTLVDLKGLLDANGRAMNVTEIAIADEVAAAAELVMGKADRIPVAVVRGLADEWLGDGLAADLIRPPGEDLFR